MSFASLARLTLTQPDRAMAALRALDLPMATRWALLALAVSLSALLVGILGLIFPAPPAPAETAILAISDAMTQRPLLLAVSQFIGVVIFAALAWQVGRMFGGTGNFADSLLALTWVDLLLIVAEVAQLALLLILPALVPILSAITFGLMIYLFVRMVGAVHGFRNPILVALGMVGTLVTVSLVLGLILGPAALGQLGGVPAP